MNPDLQTSVAPDPDRYTRFPKSPSRILGEEWATDAAVGKGRDGNEGRLNKMEEVERNKHERDDGRSSKC